jgi:hypothetical protein
VRLPEAVVSAKFLKSLALIAASCYAAVSLAQQPLQPDTEGWRELPRNTTIYVPVPRQIVPVAAYGSCSNRYQGDSCDFSAPGYGIVEGTCEAPEIRQPPAYGYNQQQYPAQIRTGLVCTPSRQNQAPAAGEAGFPPADPSNPGREMPDPPRQ